MPTNHYLVSAWISSFSVHGIADSSLTLIVPGENQAQAQSEFEKWILGRNDGDDAVPTKIEKVAGVQVSEMMITKSGLMEINWPETVAFAAAALDKAQNDQYPMGLWADVNQLIGSGKTIRDLQALRHDLPEEICSGLNWTEQLEFVFLVSALSVPEPPCLNAVEETVSELAVPDGDAPISPFWIDMTDRGESFLAMAPRESATLVAAPNAVAAAWLYRQHAHGTPLERNRLCVDSWCGVWMPEQPPE